MKKTIILLILTIIVISHIQIVHAWPLIILNTPTPALIKFNPNLIHLLDTTAPSPTNTPSPINTPTTEPTQKIEDTITPTKEIIVATDISVAPTASVTATIKVTPTVTSIQQKFPFSKKELAVAGVIGILVLIIAFQSWPKIKKTLHDKTA